MDSDEEKLPASVAALVDAVYDAQDMLFDGDFIKARESAEDALRRAGIRAGSTSGEEPEPLAKPLPARSPLARAARDAFEVALNVCLQRNEWDLALRSAESWLTACGPVEVRPLAAGLRAAFCGFSHSQASKGPSDASSFVGSSVRLGSMLFDRAHQRALAGGEEGLSAGHLLLEQAQALAQIADMAVTLDSEELLQHVEDYDELLQEKLGSDTGGMDVLEPHEQGRVAALAAWARCRATRDTQQRNDALTALNMIADGCVEDAKLSAEAAQSARTQREGNAANSSDSSDPSALDQDPLAAALAQQLGLGDANDGIGDDGGAGMMPLSPSFSLATDYVPSPLDLGLGFFYALIALGAMEGAEDGSNTAIQALDTAVAHSLTDDENVQGVFVLLHRRLSGVGASIPEAAESPARAIVAQLHTDTERMSTLLSSALGASNVLIQQRLL